MPGAKSVEAGLCFSDTSKYVPLVWKLHPTAHVRKIAVGEARENRLTLAMPIGEAASDIAGAMLKLNL